MNIGDTIDLKRDVEAAIVPAGDKVTLELSPYDINNGRITFRHIESKGDYSPPKRRTY